MKQCIKCLKLQDNFYSKNICWDCRNLYLKQYRDSHKVETLNYNIEYRKTHQDVIIANNQNYYEQNKETILQNHKLEYWEGRDRDQEKQQRILNNKLYHATYMKNRRNNDHIFKFISDFSNYLHRAITKGKSFRGFLYTVDELISHIESLFEPWMNWQNYGKYNKITWNDEDILTFCWNIDHIIPLSNLPHSSMDEENFKIAWSLNNIRPYSAKQNCIDGVNRIRHI